VVGSSRFCSRPAAPTSVRTWRTVRLVGADSPCGASRPRVLRFVACFGREGFGGPSALRPRTVCAARVALGQFACRVRIVRVSGCAAGGSVAFNRPSALGSWTVHPCLEDHPPGLSQDS
jgi:hypothetical protein